MEKESFYMNDHRIDQRQRPRRRRRPLWRRRRQHDDSVYNHRPSSSASSSSADSYDGVNANTTTTLDSSRDFECYRRVNGSQLCCSPIMMTTTTTAAAAAAAAADGAARHAATDANAETTTTIILRRVAKFIWINVMKLTLNMCRRTFRSIFGAFLQFGRRQKTGFLRCLATASSSSSSPNSSMYYAPVTTLVLFASTVLRLADACSSRSTPKPRTPSPTIRPNITFPTSVCPPNYDTWYCLNGATCFTVEISESVLYNCVCADGYTGPRCEFKDLDGSYLPSRDRIMVERASIAGGVTVAVLLIVIISIAFYIYSRRRKKERNLTVTDGIDVRPRHFRSHRLSQQAGEHSVRQCRSIYHHDLESGDGGNLRRDLACPVEDVEPRRSTSPSQRSGALGVGP